MSIASAMAGMVGKGGKRPGIAERASARPEVAAPKEETGEKGPAEHLTELHAKMGGKHMHVHSDGITHTTHQVGEDGSVEGPHDHENIEALKQHMDRFLTEEEGEQGEPEAGGGGMFD